MPEPSAAGYEPEECAWCVGAGRERLTGKPCPACRGRGAVLAAQPAAQCARCRGTGRAGYLSDGPRCEGCAGAGWEGVYKPGPGRGVVG
jgi:DnaJ-class molecular chaperone